MKGEKIELVWEAKNRKLMRERSVKVCEGITVYGTGLLSAPFAMPCTSTSQTGAFSVVGPSVWNGLPLSQGLLPRILSDTFYSSLKTLLFSRARVGRASE